MIVIHVGLNPFLREDLPDQLASKVHEVYPDLVAKWVCLAHPDRKVHPGLQV